jgi:hypothetical protein
LRYCGIAVLRYYGIHANTVIPQYRNTLIPNIQRRFSLYKDKTRSLEKTLPPIRILYCISISYGTAYG